MAEAEETDNVDSDTSSETHEEGTEEADEAEETVDTDADRENGDSADNTPIEDEEKEETPSELTRDEALDIVLSLYDEYVQTVNQFQEDTAEKYGQLTIIMLDEDPELKQQVKADLTPLLEPYFSDDYLDTAIEGLLFDLYYTMHGSLTFDKSHIQTRFQIEEQQPGEKLKVSYITLADETGYTSSGTYEIDLEKQEENWVVTNLDLISAEERPMNLTEEDIHEYIALHEKRYPDSDYSYEFVESFDDQGVEYLTYKYSTGEHSSYFTIRATDSEPIYDYKDRYQ